MPKPLILVTGATGKTGLAVATGLLEQGWRVRAVARRRDARSEALHELGAELVVADLFDSGQMRLALDGVKRAYWCAPFHPDALRAAQLFAGAARDARLELIVCLSQWLASSAHPSIATRNAFKTDALFAALAPQIGYTIVNPGFFADNYLRLIGFAAQLGVLPSLTRDSRNAPPSNEDIAAVAVAALTDPDRHAGQTYRPTGPDLLCTADMAHILTSVLGRKVRRVEMPMWMFVKAARMQGVSAFELSGFRHYVEDHKQGAFELSAPNDHVLRLANRPAEDFATIARRYAQRPEAGRSLRASVRAWADFMRTPMMPGYDLARFDLLPGALPQASCRYAMQDNHWRATHGGGPAVTVGRDPGTAPAFA